MHTFAIWCSSAEHAHIIQAYSPVIGRGHHQVGVYRVHMDTIHLQQQLIPIIVATLIYPLHLVSMSTTSRLLNLGSSCVAIGLSLQAAAIHCKEQEQPKGKSTKDTQPCCMPTLGQCIAHSPYCPSYATGSCPQEPCLPLGQLHERCHDCLQLE